MKFLLNNKNVTFNACQSIKKPKDMHANSMIDPIDEDDLMAPIEEIIKVKSLAIVIMNFEGGDIKGYDEMVSALERRGSYSYTLKKLDLDLKNKVTHLAKPSIEGPLVLELKALPSHIHYAFLGVNITESVIIVAYLVNS